MSKVTVYDVAEHAGVSATSVSNYFHNPHKLSDTTRQRIGEVVATLGFVPDDGARYLKRGVRPIVGYLSFELAAAHTPRIASAIEHEVAAHGMHLLLANDDGSRERELSYLELFERQRVSGLIVAALGDIEGELARLRARGIPSVLLGASAKSPAQPCVYTDDVAGGRLAVEHLLGGGRRRIGFVATSLDIRQVGERMRGAMEAVEDDGAAVLELIPVPERSVRAGVAVAAAIAARDVAERPDAMFCVNDLVAIGIVQGLTGQGVHIPRDIAVVGYDDIEFAATTLIPLTSVHTPDHDLGVAATELLFAEMTRMRDPVRATEPAPRTVFRPELVIRSSTIA